MCSALVGAGGLPFVDRVGAAPWVTVCSSAIALGRPCPATLGAPRPPLHSGLSIEMRPLWGSLAPLGGAALGSLPPLWGGHVAPQWGRRELGPTVGGRSRRAHCGGHERPSVVPGAHHCGSTAAAVPLCCAHRPHHGALQAVPPHRGATPAHCDVTCSRSPRWRGVALHYGVVWSSSAHSGRTQPMLGSTTHRWGASPTVGRGRPTDPVIRSAHAWPKCTAKVATGSVCTRGTCKGPFYLYVIA